MWKVQGIKLIWAHAGSLWAAGLYKSKCLTQLVPPEGTDPGSHICSLYFFCAMETELKFFFHKTNTCAKISVVTRQSMDLGNDFHFNSWCLTCSTWDAGTKAIVWKKVLLKNIFLYGSLSFYLIKPHTFMLSLISKHTWYSCKIKCGY